VANEEPAVGTTSVPESKHVSLRPLALSDYEALFHLVTRTEATFRWRFRGSTPSPDAFREVLWAGVLAQFVAETRADNSMLGLVTAYDADFSNGTVHLAALLEPDVHRRGWPIEAILLLIDYLFENWAFRKLYAESLEFNAAAFSRGAQRLFDLEGRLRSHEYFRGKHWDLLIFALYRTRWEEQRSRYERILSPGV
jgi:RimJ/RimL family protein N-acetyltransferase